ncbi:hypothetical protein [Nocardia sp. NPDC004415]
MDRLPRGCDQALTDPSAASPAEIYSIDPLQLDTVPIIDQRTIISLNDLVLARALLIDSILTRAVGIVATSHICIGMCRRSQSRQTTYRNYRRGNSGAETHTHNGTPPKECDMMWSHADERKGQR